MARNSFKATIGASPPGSISAGAGGATTVSTATLTTDVTAVTNALTAINALTGFTALTGAVAAMATAVAAVATVTADIAALAPTNSGDVNLTYDTATVTSYNALKASVDALLLLARSSGIV